MTFSHTVIFGNYRVVERPDGSLWELGKGAFGTVYRAEHMETREEVAIKVIHDHLSADEKMRTAFRKEAQEHRKLKNPGVVDIREVGEVNGSLFIVMDLCQGGNLHSWVASRPGRHVGPWEALTVLRPIADALVYAAGHGLVHRDIKPENILLARKVSHSELPQAKLADFGLAKKIWEHAAGRVSMMSVSGSSAGINGTLHYASPEQVREEAIDERTDIFSFGLTLWHVLAGGYPFPELIKAKTFTLMQERADLVSYAGRFPDSWPVCLKELMEKLVAARPEDRFKTFGRVCSAIDACLEELASAEPNSASSSASASDARSQFPSVSGPVSTGISTIGLSVREFFTLNFLAQNPLGTLFEADTPGTPPGPDSNRRHLQLLRGDLPAEIREQVERTVSLVARNPHPSLASLEGKRCRDGFAVIVDIPPDAETLIANIKKHGARRPKIVLAWLDRIAQAIDHAAALGLPGIETSPGAVTLRSDPQGDLRPVLAVKLCQPIDDLAGGGGLSAISFGTNEQALEPPSWTSGFAWLAYWLFAAHGPKESALASPVGYVSTPQLSQPGNETLKTAMCGKFKGRCVDVLEKLAGDEGLSYQAPPQPQSAAHRPFESSGQPTTPPPPPSSSPGADTMPSVTFPSFGGREELAKLSFAQLLEMVESAAVDKARAEELHKFNLNLSDQVTRLQGQIGEIQREKDSTELDRDRLKKAVDDLSIRYEEINGRLKATAKSLEDREQERHSLEERLRKANAAERQKLDVSLQQKIQEIDALKAKRTTDSAESQHLQNSLKTKADDLRFAEDRLEQKDREIRELNLRKDKADDRIAELQNALAHSERERQNLKSAADAERRRADEAAKKAEAEKRRADQAKLAATKAITDLRDAKGLSPLLRFAILAGLLAFSALGLIVWRQATNTQPKAQVSDEVKTEFRIEGVVGTLKLVGDQTLSKYFVKEPVLSTDVDAWRVALYTSKEANPLPTGPLVFQDDGGSFSIDPHDFQAGNNGQTLRAPENVSVAIQNHEANSTLRLVLAGRDDNTPFNPTRWTINSQHVGFRVPLGTYRLLWKGDQNESLPVVGEDGEVWHLAVIEKTPLEKIQAIQLWKPTSTEWNFLWMGTLDVKRWYSQEPTNEVTREYPFPGVGHLTIKGGGVYIPSLDLINKFHLLVDNQLWDKSRASIVAYCLDDTIDPLERLRSFNAFAKGKPTYPDGNVPADSSAVEYTDFSPIASMKPEGTRNRSFLFTLEEEKAQRASGFPSFTRLPFTAVVCSPKGIIKYTCVDPTDPRIEITISVKCMPEYAPARNSNTVAVSLKGANAVSIQFQTYTDVTKPKDLQRNRFAQCTLKFSPITVIFAEKAPNP